MLHPVAGQKVRGFLERPLAKTNIFTGLQGILEMNLGIPVGFASLPRELLDEKREHASGVDRARVAGL
jgi:hypothetical protein